MTRFEKAVKAYGGRRVVAEALGCSVEFVRLLIVGDKTPGLALALKIAEELRIPVTYWKDRSTQANTEKAS